MQHSVWRVAQGLCLGVLLPEMVLSDLLFCLDLVSFDVLSVLGTAEYANPGLSHAMTNGLGSYGTF